MKDYTAVCIGGSQDGNLITSNHRNIIVPVLEPATALCGTEVPIHQKPFKREDYRIELFACGDRRNPIPMYVFSELSVRQAMNQMLDAYTGAHIPKHSSRKAERTEVEILMNRIRLLEVLVECSRAVIQKLRDRLGDTGEHE